MLEYSAVSFVSEAFMLFSNQFEVLNPLVNLLDLTNKVWSLKELGAF